MRAIVHFMLPCIVKKPFLMELPSDLEILGVNVQKGNPRLYGICNSVAPIKVKRTFRIYGNLEPVEDCSHTYIGTFIVTANDIAMHLFEFPDDQIIKPV
jgi:hypothetical protein